VTSKNDNQLIKQQNKLVDQRSNMHKKNKKINEPRRWGLPTTSYL